MSDEITCREVVELVTDYLEGALAPGERHRFEQHLGECDVCVGFVESIRVTIAIAGRVDVAELPPDAERELVAAFRGWRG